VLGELEASLNVDVNIMHKTLFLTLEIYLFIFLIKKLTTFFTLKIQKFQEQGLNKVQQI